MKMFHKLRIIIFAILNFISLCLYHVIFINTFAKIFHLASHGPVSLPSLKTIIQYSGWPVLLSISTMVITAFLKLQLSSRYKVQYYFIVLLCVDCVFMMFASIFFTHYNYRGYLACVSIDTHTKVPAVAFEHRFGNPDKKSPELLTYTNFSNGYEESCSIVLDQAGNIISKEMSVKLK